MFAISFKQNTIENCARHIDHVHSSAARHIDWITDDSRSQTTCCLLIIVFILININIMNKLTNIDIRGICRGACQKPQCECTEYICKSDSATESVLLCLYCGHLPINHASMLDISNTGMYIHIFSLLER